MPAQLVPDFVRYLVEVGNFYLIGNALGLGHSRVGKGLKLGVTEFLSDPLKAVFL